MPYRLFEGVTNFLQVSGLRKKVVLEDIQSGAVPQFNYYLMMALSALIAAFGLLTNSPAVVIGAMLISPLMTPIFGISLSLVRGNTTLLRYALLGEFSGVALAIGVSALLGLLPFPWEVTPEILARTRPTLLDLGVAVFAGTAGCIAMIDERLSPVLPGIAIATSLTPPLSACGLCIALKAYAGAWGAFLLFFANFLAILMISALLFVVAGFVTRAEMGSGTQVARRFSVAMVSLLVVVVLLTQTLISVFGEVRTSKAIEAILTEELGRKPSTSLNQFKFKLHKAENSLDVLAAVKTPNALDPREVKAIEDRIEKALGYQTTLITSCILVKDVSAQGSSSAVVSTDLDGEFIAKNLPPRIVRFQLAEQVLREILQEHPGLTLGEFDLVELETGPVLLATIKGSRTLKPTMVADFEQRIQARLVDYQVRLLVRSEKATGISSKGQVLLGVAHFNQYTSKDLEQQFRLEEAARDELRRVPHLTVVGLDAIKEEAGWRILAEAVGPHAITPQQVNTVQKRLSAAAGVPVQMEVIFRAEVIVDSRRYYASEVDSEP
jgi:uncharacterized hydrophobic protein (TIGR00271 family)